MPLVPACSGVPKRLIYDTVVSAMLGLHPCSAYAWGMLWAAAVTHCLVIRLLQVQRLMSEAWKRTARIISAARVVQNGSVYDLCWMRSTCGPFAAQLQPVAQPIAAHTRPLLHHKPYSISPREPRCRAVARSNSAVAGETVPLRGGKKRVEAIAITGSAR